VIQLLDLYNNNNNPNPNPNPNPTEDRLGWLMSTFALLLTP